MPPAFVAWVTGRAREIEAVRDMELTDPTAETRWSVIESDNATLEGPGILASDVSPLLSTTWNQGQYYNDLCPSDGSSTAGNGHVWAGCVATAVAQVMRYHQHPAQGAYGFAYLHDAYGLQEADFAAHTYNWSAMPNNVTATHTGVATLLRDCGVASRMDYGPDGSGAYTHTLADALPLFFGYNTNVVYVSREEVTDLATWKSILQSELANGRPLVYDGNNETSGHAFVCDGYRSSDDTFHFNWGWSGAYDGYFDVNDLTPGTRSYNDGQGILRYAEPAATSGNYLFYARNGQYLWYDVVDNDGDGTTFWTGYFTGTSDHFIIVDAPASGTGHSDWLIGPPLSLPASASATFSIAMRAYGGASSMRIRLSTGGTNPADFTTVLDTIVESSAMSDYETHHVALDAYQGQTIRVAVEVFNTEYYTFLDDAFVTYEPATAPDPPADVSASDGLYTGHVAVAWSSSAGATQYQVYRADTSEVSGSAPLGSPVSGSPYLDPSAGAGQIYYYWVKAGNAQGWSDYSSSDAGHKRAVYQLLVSSSYPDVTPAAGTHAIPSGESVDCSASEFSEFTTTTAWRRATSTGWNGTGSVPTSGVGRTLSVTVVTNSSIAWAWSLCDAAFSNTVVTTAFEETASDTLRAGNGFTIKPGADVTFTAGDEVRLRDGFTAEQGSSFRARNTD